MKTTLQFTVLNETKGAIRYQEQTDTEAVVGTLYVRKSALKGAAIPATLTVTIEAQ